MTHMAAQTPTRLMMVDDHDIIRDGIRARLGTAESIELVGECASAGEAIAMAGQLKPDVVLLDISMPGMNGLEAAGQILKASPQSRILFLSIYDNEQYVLEALRVGGSGYILKDVSRAEMIAAIAAVASGGTYLGARLAGALTERHTARQQHTAPYGLTDREIDVLRKISQGYSNKETASQLGISVRTVESHRASIREKTGGGNAAALAVIARKLGVGPGAGEPQ
ncbi:MAG: response regulator transcription factor [Rhizobiaceae bacterium]